MGHNRNGTPLAGNIPRGYYRTPNERYWVNAHNLNEPGDTTYHGPKLNEVVAERKEEKAKDEAAAEKLRKGKLRARKAA